MRKVVLLIFIFMLTIGFSGLSYPQEGASEPVGYKEEEGAASEEFEDWGEEADVENEDAEDVEYAYGTVVSLDLNSNKIMLSEYDWKTDSEINVTYTIYTKVELEGVPSLEKISPKNYADIEYIVDKNGNKIAKYISIYTEEELEEEE